MCSDRPYGVLKITVLPMKAYRFIIIILGAADIAIWMQYTSISFEVFSFHETKSNV
jgi:hypothetical protein